MKLLKKVSILIILIIIALALMILFSPYGSKDGFDEKLVIDKILIDASVEEVYAYLGNSDNAQEWSVFVDHITPTNLDTYKDGEVGSIRRCYQNEEESGIIWDEKILIDEPNKRRRLNIFNMIGFSLVSDNLLTEQLYTDKGGKCELALTLFFDQTNKTWLDDLKLYYAAYQVSPVFKDNLKNIKKYNEKH